MILWVWTIQVGFVVGVGLHGGFRVEWVCGFWVSFPFHSFSFYFFLALAPLFLAYLS